MKTLSPSLLLLLAVVFIAPLTASAQQAMADRDSAEAVLNAASRALGGDKYLQIKNQVGRGRFSIIRDGVIISFQSFIDVIVFPEKERTDFKSGGVRSVQTNVGNTGWLYDGDAEMIKDQDEKQIENFKRGIRVSMDNLIRGGWRKTASLTYLGKRPSTLGKRNDVLKLTYDDGFAVEFEFATETSLPQKAKFKRLNTDNEEIIEEDRYAQFVNLGGVMTPLVIDRFTNGNQSSRINFESVEYNKSIPEAIFSKPSSPKELRKDLKL